MKKISKKRIIDAKKETKELVGAITLTILDIIFTVPEAVVGAFLNQKDAMNRIDNYDGEFRSSAMNYLNNLVRSGYIEKKIINGNQSVRLTTKGKIKLLESTKNNEQDGKFRYISFDIPESMRMQRDQLRRSIKRIGFKQLQKSLWVCPFIKADQIDLILDELKVRKYIAYLVVDRTNIDDFVKNLFEN